VHRMLVPARPRRRDDKPAGRVDTSAKTVDNRRSAHSHDQREVSADGRPTNSIRSPRKRTNPGADLARQSSATPVKKGRCPTKLKPLPGVVKGQERRRRSKRPRRPPPKIHFLQMAGGDDHKSYLIGTADRAERGVSVIPRLGTKGQPHEPLECRSQARAAARRRTERPLDKLLAARTRPPTGARARKINQRDFSGRSRARRPRSEIDHQDREENLERGTAGRFTSSSIRATKSPRRRSTADQPGRRRADTHWGAQGRFTDLKPARAAESRFNGQAGHQPRPDRRERVSCYYLSAACRPGGQGHAKIQMGREEGGSGLQRDDNFPQGIQTLEDHIQGPVKAEPSKAIFFPNKNKKEDHPARPYPLTMKLNEARRAAVHQPPSTGAALKQGMKVAVLQGFSPLEFTEVGARGRRA